MNVDRIRALLEEAARYFDAGEEYAHHARRPVAAALKEINSQQKERRWNPSSPKLSP